MLCLSTSLHKSLQDRYPVFLWVILLTGDKCLPGCTSVDMWCSMNKFFSPFAKFSSPVSPITSSISSTHPLSKYLLLSLLLLLNHLPPLLLSLLLPPSPPPIHPMVTRNRDNTRIVRKSEKVLSKHPSTCLGTIYLN